MRPPAAATDLAQRALKKLAPTDRASASIPGRIASAALLTVEDIAVATDFFAQPAQNTDAYRLAHALMGGHPLHRALQAAALPAVKQIGVTGQPVTAAAVVPFFPELSAVISALNAQLSELDREASTEIRTAVQMAYSSALDRIGRMVTRAAGADSVLRSVSGIEAAVIASAVDMAEISNPSKLIAPAIDDAVAYVRNVVSSTRARVETLISEAFAVDLDIEWAPLDPALKALADGISDEVLFRADSTQLARIDPSTDTGDPLQAPYALTRNLLASAGGGTHTDTIGRPANADGFTGVAGIGRGPTGVQTLQEAIVAWADSVESDGSVVAAARRRPGALISSSLRAELAEAATKLQPADDQAPEMVQVVENIWRLDWNGAIETEHVLKHEQLAGIVVRGEGDLAQLVRDAGLEDGEWPGAYPGSHRYCRCGWETVVRFATVTVV